MQEVGTPQPTKDRRRTTLSTTGPDSIIATLNSISFPFYRFDGLIHKWRSSSGWDDKCHIRLHITITTVASTIKLRRLSRKVRIACQKFCAGLLGDPPPVRRRSIQSGHRRFVEPQINGQLSAMVREVAEHSVRNHDMPQILVSYVAAHHKFPGS
jgi:hypothetical protein